MTAEKILGVAFDMDGLMIDSERLTYMLYTQECKKLGFDCTEEIFKSLIGLRRTDTRKKLLEVFGETFNFNTLYVNNKKAYFEYIEKNGVPVKEGLFELLEFLKLNGIKSCVATSTSEETSTKLLNKAGIMPYLDTLVCGTMVKVGKPAPDIFLKAAEKMQLNVKNCLGIEDSYNGIRSINSAGIRAIMVPDMLPPTPETKKLTIATVTTLADVINIIKQINCIK